MTNQHPITPPPELVREWNKETLVMGTHFPEYKYSEFIATRAAQWGADQELEACCEVLHQQDRAYLLPSQLRAARRPKPPSLAEVALKAIDPIIDGTYELRDIYSIRAALERLQQLENNQ